MSPIGWCRIHGFYWLEKNQWLPLDGEDSMVLVGTEFKTFIGWCKIHSAYWLVQNQ